MFRPDKYRRDGTPYPAGNRGLLEWGRDLECHGTRMVDETYTPWGDRVSTVWLGLDHGWGEKRPVIFETMVFDRKGESIQCDRYCTELEARDGHLRHYYLALVPPMIVRFLRKYFGAAD